MRADISALAEQIESAALNSGRFLPLDALLSVLRGESAQSALVSESKHTLSTHKVLQRLRDLWCKHLAG